MTQPRRRSLRFPIFWKFLASTLFLVVALQVSSYYYAKVLTTRAASRTQFMDKHLKRYLEYQQGLGAAVESVALVVGSDDELARALAEGQPQAAAEHVARVQEVLGSKHAIRPDVVVLFDAEGKLVYASEGSPIGAVDLGEMEAISRVRRGDSYHDALVLHGGRVLQAAGVPLRAPGGKGVVGGLLIAIDVTRYFGEFQRQSDDKPELQHRLTLVKGGQVVISAFPPEKHKALAEAMEPHKRREIVTPAGSTVRVVDFDGKMWDFAEAELNGFIGPGWGSLGKLYLMRYREPPRDQSSGMLGALALAIGLSVIVAAIMAVWVTKSLKMLIRATREIADGAGDLTKRIEINSNDEIADLAANLNRVFDNLYRLAHDVQSASMQVGASSAEISAASKQMLEGAKDQAVKIESSTAAVTELSSSIQTVAANATSATKVARESNDAVNSAVASMERIRTTVDSAADKIQELGESGKRIGNIVEVIRQISEQTSLLALNASIEAAHAGEQGRGFAVVADEVSSLARRVGQSAKDIEDLIATIKEQTADAVRAMQAGTREVEAGTHSVTGTLENLKRIIEMVQDTAGAVQEQAIVSDEIARNMDAVQKIANEVLASSEEAVIQGEQLHALAHHLEESVRGFNLEGDGAATAATSLPAPRAPAARKTLPAPAAPRPASRKSAVRRVARPDPSDTDDGV